jgi:hypothetical protein
MTIQANSKLQSRRLSNLSVLRYSDEIILTKSVPQEEQRFQVRQGFLHRTDQNLKEHVQRWTTELVFHLEEVSIPDWEDRNTRNIVLPATRRGQMAHHGISRNVKHISMIARVSTPRKSHIPYIIPLQDLASVRKQLKKDGVEF